MEKTIKIYKKAFMNFDEEIKKILDKSFQKILNEIKQGKIPLNSQKISKLSQTKQEIEEIRRKKSEIEEKRNFLENEKQIHMESEKKRKYYENLFSQIERNKNFRIMSQEKRAFSQQSFNRFYKNYVESKPLYKIKEEEYLANKNKHFQEKKSRIFKDLKEFYKPHDKSFFDTHRENYKKLKKESAEIRKRKIIARSLDFKNNKTKFWRGNCHKNIENEIIMQKKTKFPKIKENSQKNSPQLLKIQINQKNIGLDYLDFSKKKGKKHRSNSESHLFAQNNEEIIKMPKINYKNYLKDLPKNSANHPLYSSWKKDLKDSSLKYLQKYDRILTKAEVLDAKAALHEKYLKFCGENFETRTKLNEILFNSISAKISILKDII